MDQKQGQTVENHDEAELEGNGAPDFDERTTEKRKRKRKKGFGIGKLIGGIAIGMAFILVVEAVALCAMSSGGLNLIQVFSKMAVIEKYIDEYYLYEADSDDMADGIFAGMLASLTEDNYAQYFSAEAYKEENIRETGNYIGIGITVVKDETTGGILIAEVTPYGPAEEAGLLEGDIIIQADGVDLTVLEMGDAVDNHIKGEAGTKVNLTYLRDGKELNVDVERRNIVNHTVFSKVIEKDEIENSRLGNLRIGYIGISQFIRSTSADFDEAFEDLAYDEEVNGIIIDLRNNGGGDVDICMDMLDRLIEDDRALAKPQDEDGADLNEAKEGASDAESTQNNAEITENPEDAKNAEENEKLEKTDSTGDSDNGEDGALLLTIENKHGGKAEYFATDRMGADIPIVLLVNSHSASASEIFAGTMQDYGYMVMGTKTFGKGIVQSIIGLHDGSAIKFTTEQYRLPGGAYVHKVGIEPDKVVEFEEFDDVKDTMTNYGKGEEELITKDNQVKAALAYLENEAYEAFQRQ